MNFWYGFLAGWGVFSTILVFGDWFCSPSKSGVILDKGWLTYTLCLPWLLVLMPFLIVGRTYNKLRWRYRLWRKRHALQKGT